MYIQIIDNKTLEMILSTKTKGQPFSVGEIVDVSVDNHDDEFWDISPIRGVFKVVKISHDLRQSYGVKNKFSEAITTLVYVEKQ